MQHIIVIFRLPPSHSRNERVLPDSFCANGGSVEAQALQGSLAAPPFYFCQTTAFFMASLHDA
jgi:hypothetical protein